MPTASEQINNMVSAAIRPLRNRMYTMISRAVVELAKSEEGMQTLKATVLAGEDRDGIEHFEAYGFTSNPLPDSEAVIVCPAGSREHMIALAVGNRTYRLKGLEQGEVAIYTDEGDKIHFKRGGEVDIVTSAKVNIQTGEATVTATTKAKIDSPAIELGQTAVEAVIKGNTFQTLFNAHKHVGNLGYDTAPPTVQLTGSELSTVSKTQ